MAQAQNLTALGELVSTTTHEFNNVLMTIINYAKYGLRHQDRHRAEKAFENILAAGNRAAKITNCVLGVARIRSCGQDAVDLAQVVEDTLMLLEREMNKYRIKVEKQYAQVPQVYANGNQIQQILLNLMINARQAMPGGSRLLIKLAHDAETTWWTWWFATSAAGFPPTSCPTSSIRSTRPRTVPTPAARGSGLGLSMCRDIIEAHHGRIRVDSSPGIGTAITLKIPSVTRAAEESPRPPAAIGPMTLPINTVSAPVS